MRAKTQLVVERMVLLGTEVRASDQLNVSCAANQSGATARAARAQRVKEAFGSLGMSVRLRMKVALLM